VVFAKDVEIGTSPIMYVVSVQKEFKTLFETHIARRFRSRNCAIEEKASRGRRNRRKARTGGWDKL